MLYLGDMQADAVIFDFDGVIVDTEPLHCAAFNQVLEPAGLGFTWEEYAETYMGFDDRDAFLEVYRRYGREMTAGGLQELIDRKAQLFQEVIRGGVSAYPGVVGLIRRIRQQQIPLAISSGALRSDIVPILDILGIADCFDVIVTAEDVARSKPDPECYTLARTLLAEQFACRIEPERTVAVEDTPAGITAANGAGLKVVAVTNSYAAEQLDQADLITGSLEDLPFRTG